MTKEIFETAIKLQNEKNFTVTQQFYKLGLYKDNVSMEDVLKVFPDVKTYRNFYNNHERVVKSKSKSWGLSREETIKKIKKDDILMKEVMPNAKRQRIHEKVQMEELQKCVKALNKTHKGKCIISIENNVKNYNYVITDEGIIKERCISNSYNESKSFDFIVNVNKNGKSYRLFGVMKHTRENGGMQDDVCREVETTHKYCKLNTNEYHKFIFVLDGNFWTNKGHNILTSKNIVRTTTEKLKLNLSNLIKQL